ncbi:hypothetical protein SLS62_003327 [Diatrype stigma]|uniref:Berberine/berberine-like domain-containing protein n=1 Tax=Diatrype stigma TaxID=117547 RepID=A0AAN9UWU4_9PEZI
MRQFGFDPRTFYFPVGMPFMADTPIGKSHLDGGGSDGHGHGHGHGHGTSSFVQLTKVTTLSEELTGPEGGAYTNEVNLFTRDWRQAWWGPNFDALLATKRKYDPYGLLNCW